METKSDTLFFVNKTASSNALTHSGSQEAHLILQHVQKRRRKQEDGKTAKSLSWAKYVSSIQLQQSDESPPSNPTNMTNAAHTSVTLLRVYPTGNQQDPFYCTVAGHDAAAQAILHYSFSHIATATYAAEAMGPSNWSKHRLRHMHMVEARRQRCVDDETLMYSTLASGSTFMAWMLGRVEDGPLPEYFVHKALQAVRAALASPTVGVSNWLLLSIHALAITELWMACPQMWTKFPVRKRRALGNSSRGLKACRTHLMAMVSLSQRLEEEIEPYVLDAMILCDKFLALIEMVQPILPLHWDPGPRPHCGQFIVGNGFAKMDLDPELMALVVQISEFISFARQAWARAELSPEEEAYLFRRHQALNYQLLRLHHLTGVAKCARLGVLLFLQSIILFLGNQVSAAVVAQQTRNALREEEPSQNTYPVEFLFWCSCTGAMVAVEDDEKWFVQRVLSFADRLSLDRDTIGAWEEVLGQFLYVKERQQKPLHALLEKLRTVK